MQPKVSGLCDAAVLLPQGPFRWRFTGRVAEAGAAGRAITSAGEAVADRERWKP